MIIIKNTTLKVAAVLILTAIVSCNFEKNKSRNEMIWNDEFDYSGFPDSTIFPQSLVVDWVRVYRKTEGNEKTDK